VRYRRAVGCEECASSGYRGRTGIYELLVLNDALRAQVVAGASLDGLRAAARAQGMPTLRDEAWRVAREGRTSLEEVWRVTGGLDDEQ
jgi:general secretion pathway protein E